MRVHHLDCATLCPRGGHHMHPSGRLVTHCLLVETPGDGLVLIDSGIGTADLADPRPRLGRLFLAQSNPVLDERSTALHQIRTLGFDPRDVGHVILTHLDADHAGGIADFPWARIHVHLHEHEAAVMTDHGHPHGGRYRPLQWSHGPHWALHDAADGEEWFGFPHVRSFPGLGDDLLAVPLTGHTPGHTAVAVNTGGPWLLHAGDAYFNQATVDPTRGRPPAGARLFEATVAHDRHAVRSNHARLRSLAEGHPHDISIFCAHDPDEFARLRDRSR